MFSYIFNAGNLHELREFPGQEYEGMLSLGHQSLSESCTPEKTSIEYSVSEQKVVIKSAIGNPLTLFWGWLNKDLIVADNVNAVLNAIKNNENINADDFDKVGVIESILFDGPLVDRTLFQCVKKVQAAEELVFDLHNKNVEKKWRWLPKIQISPISNYAQAKEEAAFHIANLRKNIQIAHDGITLPITGGLDSRLLASLVRDVTAAPVFSYTFQRGWSFESWCAKKVAKQLNSHHSIFNLGKDCYKNFAKKVVQASGGMVTGMHTHGIYCCEKLLPKSQQDLARMFGYFGDPVTGAMTEKANDGLLVSSPLDVFKKYSASLFPNLVDQFKDEIIADLDQTYKAFQISESPAHTFHEFWKIQQRQNNLITHLFHYHRAHHGVKVHEPFIDQGFIDFFLSLSLEQRFNRSLFKEVSAELFPDVFSLPSMHFKPKSLFAKIEYGCERVEDVFNKINGRQELFLSPFRYEHHDKNLQNYLLDDIHKGVSAMVDIFSCAPAKISYPMWKSSSSPKEHYRLAALGYLFNN